MNKVRPIRKLTLFFLLAAMASLLSCAPTLPKQRAAHIVSQYMGYPKPLMGIVTAGPAKGAAIKTFIRGINKLESEGYVTALSSKGGEDRSYLPTEKSKAYMTGIYIKESYPLYEGAVCREVLKSVDGIEFTHGHDAATVSFTTAIEPIEPVYSLLCINRFCDCFGRDFKKTKTLKLKLHRDERGWRIGG
jgi:hypothetical protein